MGSDGGGVESRAACRVVLRAPPRPPPHTPCLILFILCVSIPTKDPSGQSLIMSPEEFERIKWASHVLTKEELEAREQAFKKEKEAIVVPTPTPSLQSGG